MANIANRHFISLPLPPREVAKDINGTPDVNALLSYIKDLHRDLENVISLLSKSTQDIDGGTP